MILVLLLLLINVGLILHQVVLNQKIILFYVNNVKIIMYLLLIDINVQLILQLYKLKFKIVLLGYGQPKTILQLIAKNVLKIFIQLIVKLVQLLVQLQIIAKSTIVLIQNVLLVLMAIIQLKLKQCAVHMIKYNMKVNVQIGNNSKNKIVNHIKL